MRDAEWGEEGPHLEVNDVDIATLINSLLYGREVIAQASIEELSGGLDVRSLGATSSCRKG